MAFKVDNDNWLLSNDVPVAAIPCSQQKYSSGNNICDYIVFHYTGSGSAKSAHNTYQLPSSQVSWHLTLDMDGTVYQLLDFRKRAWHAGISNWTKPDGSPTGGLNKWAIGIEMINPGPLSYKNGRWETWYGSAVPQHKIFVDENNKAWYNYTAQQKAAADAIVPALIAKYKCVDILGHEDISPGRKTDPGPAFWSTLNQLKQKYIK